MDAYSTPPPVSPRRDRTLPLRRYHSSNPEYSRSVYSPKRSEYTQNNLQGNNFHHGSQSIVKSRMMDNSSRKDYSQNKQNAATVRQRSQTHSSRIAECNEDLYLSVNEIASLPLPRRNPVIPVERSKHNSLPRTAIAQDISTVVGPHSNYLYSSARKNVQPETAIYGVAQGKGTNLVMEFKEVQEKVNQFYKKITRINNMSPEIADLKSHLRISDALPINDLLQKVHQELQPTETTKSGRKEDESIYLVDFVNCNNKLVLKEQLLKLFVTPGPPSVAYQRINAKLDGVINNFAETVVWMMVQKKETVMSPFHAQNILQGAGQEADQIVRVLQNNELWIRWGTESGLPPLDHIYMLKQSPSYEMRKAVILSQIAERKDVIQLMFSKQTRPEAFMPPVYSKLKTSDRWQVTEYDREERKFETRECAFPSWIEACSKVSSHLQSGNRTLFHKDEHVHALYSVYMVVIKNISLSEESYVKESRMPCNYQLFIGSSTTGVLYRFLNVKNNHCDRIKNVLSKAADLDSYRCFQECDLVEACLAIAWLRNQPRAVFVINSFQEGEMTNLSLNKKKPFYDKMVNLQQHYVNSKKIGPLTDMRYGMNPLGDVEDTVKI